MNDIILISGGFDPVHSGHIALIQEASKFGDVVVLLNSDNWLRNKKEKEFLKSGSSIIETNSFSSTSISQGDYLMSDLAYELNLQSAKIARDVCNKYEKERCRFCPYYYFFINYYSSCSCSPYSFFKLFAHK